MSNKERNPEHLSTSFVLVTFLFMGIFIWYKANNYEDSNSQSENTKTPVVLEENNPEFPQEKKFDLNIPTSLSPSDHPSKFCGFGAEIGLPAYFFHTTEQDDGGHCGSDLKDISNVAGKNGLPNNIQYHVMEDYVHIGRLRYISVVININNTEEYQKTLVKNELYRVANIIYQKLLKQPAPKDVLSVIAKEKSKKWPGNEWTIEVVSDKWNTRAGGYDTTLKFSPSKI